MTRWWWVRHGPTHARTMVGWTDLPADLSDGSPLARLRDILPREARVLSSDLSRARDTAQALGLAPEEDPALRELHYGAWEGRSYDEVDPALARRFWEAPGDVAPPGGESWNDLTARLAPVIARQNALGGDVIAVAHMGVILAALALATGMAPAMALSFRVAPLSLTRLDWLDGPWAVDRINHQP
ncbi:histidine phosphatase family protein [Pontivivens ytuae]|uniref:Histidine phosphatase family protein n=1 Tax=Pontivivens ytuae TaxID=2789856 RepID=A0A7S9QDD5_9RHOB|nr:histidine phosphatase family protein [Pontivivens ytuae]QPH55173.1 histidine phosphatase family protein [Pontivivens ytuae]